MRTHVPSRFILFFFGSFLTLDTLPVCAQTWDTLANVPEQLTFPVATVLDGKIHVMGGGGTGGATDKHYQYDPATDTWTTLAPVPYKAQQPAGAANAGKIHYFGGGYPNTGTPLNDHYIYDPTTDSWSAGADLTAPRAIHYAVSLNDELYSLAGQGMANLFQVYDEANDAWITKNNLPDNSFWYGAHIVTNGKIYRFGGGGYTAPVNKAHEYNPATDSWSPIPNLPEAIHGLKGAAIGDKIFLVGGYYNFLDHDEIWVYDVNTQTYEAGTPLPIGRTYHNVLALDSCLYVIGGNNAIDPNVGVSLIRLCPYESVSTSGEISPSTIAASYHSGKLVVQTTGKISSHKVQLNLFDISGRKIHGAQLLPSADGRYETEPGNLPASIYLIELRTESETISGKVFIGK